MYKVAVLISTYNGERYLKYQIESILNLINCDLTIVVRDDGSTDRTISILNSYKSDNFIILKGNNIGPCQSFLSLLFGMGANFYKNYDYIAFCDQDDIWEEDKISSAIEQMTGLESQPVLYYSALKIFNSRKKSTYIRVNSFELNFLESLFISQFPGCTMVLNQTGVIEILKRKKPLNAIMHDWYIYQFFSGNGYVIIYERNPHINYRIHTGNFSVKKSGFFQEIKRLFLIALKRRGERMRMVEEINSYAFTQDMKYSFIIRDYKRRKYKAIYLIFSTRFSLFMKIKFSISMLLNIF